MSHDQILRDLKAGKVQPVYFLHGTEPYFIDLVSNYAEKELLSEAEQGFNLTVLYGKDTDHLTVLDAARRYPMMAPLQVVVLKEAQDMKSLPELINYVEKPTPTTALFICHKHKKFNTATKFGTALKSHAVILESKELYDNQMPAWIQDYLKSRQLKITPAALHLVIEYLGTNLSKVANELDKLALNLPAGISKDYNVFELQKALGERNVQRVGRIVNYFGANPKSSPLIATIASLYNYFSRVYMLQFVPGKSDKEQAEAMQLRNMYFLRDYKTAAANYPRRKLEDIIGYLHEYDLKSKGVNIDSANYEDGDLLRELVWKILH
jgi:DNA polymerase-3 subunit delta